MAHGKQVTISLMVKHTCHEPKIASELRDIVILSNDIHKYNNTPRKEIFS